MRQDTVRAEVTGKRRRWPALASYLIACLALVATAIPAFATAELTVQVIDDPTGTAPLEVTLTAADGKSWSSTDDDGDGIVLFSPGRAGDYQVTVTLADATASYDVRIPESGLVTLSYRPGAAGDKFQVEIGESDAIYVTARKREEDVQKIPISITVFDESAIEERSLKDLSDIADFTPNVDFSVTGGFSDQTHEATVYIRGVGQIDTAVFSDPAVGIYVDGAYLARSQGAVLDLFDVERVEVLRGPQGTLFGKNSTGGALSLVTQKPAGERQGRIEATFGEFNRIDGRLSLDLPLGDKVSSKLSILSSNRDGFSRSLTTGQRYHDDERNAARLALRFLPSDRWTIDLSAEAVQQSDAGGNQILLALLDTPILRFYNNARIGAGLLPYDERWVTPNLRDSYATGSPFIDGDIFGTSLRWTWTARDLAVTSITAFRSTDYSTFGEGDGSPLIVAERNVKQDHEQWSQEIQITGSAADGDLTWVAGGIYFEEQPRETSNQFVLADLFPALEQAPGPIYAPPGIPDFLCNPGPPPPGLPCFGGPGNPFNFAFLIDDRGLFQDLDLDTVSYAIFGEGTYDLSDRLSATLGVRYTRDDKRFTYQQRQTFMPPADLFNSDQWDAWTPRFSLAYQAKPELLLYLSASRGFKSGGFNGRPQQRALLDPFDPETVWTYEIGFKTGSYGPGLTLNGAAFFSDYQDIQFGASLDVGGMPVFVTQNAGSAEIVGFELEAVAQPVTGLTLSGAVGYNDNEFTELDPGVPAGLNQNGVLPKSPEWTMNASLQYAFEASVLGDVIARADWRYRDDVFNNVQNTPEASQKAYDLLNARILVAPSERWEVSIFGTNLTDESYLETAFATGAFGPILGIPARPREWGASVQLSF